MRLLRRKIYRAFPELDRFSDDQCARFVATANSSWRRLLVRRAVMTLVALCGIAATGAAVVAVGTWVESMRHAGDLAVQASWAAAGIVGFGLALTIGLVVRDLIMRRTIRGLIRRCGSCPKCQYSLLGMRVGAGCTIICPECGTTIDVDPSLGELASDESGVAVFKPQVAREAAFALARRKRRHRLFIKWSAIGLASFVAILAAAYGLWWWTLVRQAQVARSERTTLQRLSELRATQWPGGPRPDSESQWMEFLALTKAVQVKQDEAQRSARYVFAEYGNAYFDAAVLLPQADAAAFDKTNGKGAFAATKRLTLDVIATCKADGTTDNLRRLLELSAPMRPIKWDPKRPFFEFLIDGMTEARVTARFNGARMTAAMNGVDREEFLLALEENLAIARICARQGTLIEHLVAIAIQDLTISRIMDDQSTFPTPEWRRAVLDVLLRRADAPPIAEAMEVERVGGLDGLQHFFSDPSQVRNAQLGFGSSMFWGPMRPGPFGMGTYAENKAELNAMYDGVVATAKQDAWLPAPIIPTSTLPVVNMLTPALGRAMTSAGKAEYDYRKAVFAMAVRVYKDRTGAYPAKPDDLAALVLDKKLLIDPNTGRQFWFTERQVTGAGAPRTVLDITDFPGKPAATPDSDAAPAPDAAPSPPTLAP